MKALTIMVETYKKNPNFGDVKKFQGELDTTNSKLQKLEAEAQQLTKQLTSVLNGLDDTGSPLRSRANSVMSVASSRRSADHNDYVNITDVKDDFDDDFNEDVNTSIPIPPPPAPNMVRHQN